MIYDSVDVLPVVIYFKIQQTSDLNLLVKKGKYEEEKLKSIWAKINEEYREIDQNEESKLIFSSLATIAKLEAIIDKISFASMILSYQQDEEAIKVLRYYGISNLDLINQVIEGYAIRIEEEQDKINKIIKSKDKQVTNIHDILAHLSKALGMPLQFNKVTCSEFVAYKNCLK